MTSKRQARTVRFLLAFALFALWASTTAFLVLNTSISQYLILQDAYITWVDPSADANTAFDNDDVLSHLRAGVCGGTATLTINVRHSSLRRDSGLQVQHLLLVSIPIPTRTQHTDIPGRCHRVVADMRAVARQPARPRPLRPPLAVNPRDGRRQHVLVMLHGRVLAARPARHGRRVHVPGLLVRGRRDRALARDQRPRATALVAYKSWRYRALLRKYIEVGTRISRLEKVTVLLVESGIVYCLLWIVVAILLSGLNNEGVLDSDAVMQLSSFWETFSVFLQGGLVPTIAIYPTVIIVVVALDRSQVEKRFWTTHGHQGHTETVLPVEDEYKTSVDGLRPFALAAQHHLGRAPLLAEE